jgi:putative nucleotidyltransferase with HDIG domain
VLAAPLLALWVCTSVIYFDIPIPAVLLIALSLTLVTAGVAAEIWERRPGAREISFSELLLWSWYRLQRADERLAESHRRIAEVDSSPEEQLLVLQELSDALESKDPYTRGHSSRVERHSFNIAVALGLSLKEIEVLRKAASLHDVGKMRIPNSVLHKPGKVDDEERALIEEHPVLGAWMVASIGDEQIVRTVRHHHERWDGTGYPDRIAGTDIPLFARIIAVADTYDAVTSTRSYRVGGSRKRALDIIRTEAGAQFDPQVVEAFLTTLPVRSPVVAGLALLAGPQLIWRHFMQWLQRFGAGAVAPGLGALGAAVVLGASTFVAPGGATAEPASDAPSAPTVATTERDMVSPLTFDRPAGDVVLGKRITKKGAAAKRAKEAARDRVADKATKRTSARTTRSAHKRQASSGPTRSSQEQAPDRDTNKAVIAAPAPSQPKPTDTTTEPQAPRTPPASGVLDDIDDPRDEGKDCDDRVRGSKGAELHCDDKDD